MFIKTSVSKKLFTDLYFEVSDDFNIKKLLNPSNISNATSELDSLDWSEGSIKVNGVQIVTKEEANKYLLSVLNE